MLYWYKGTKTDAEFVLVGGLKASLLLNLAACLQREGTNAALRGALKVLSSLRVQKFLLTSTKVQTLTQTLKKCNEAIEERAKHAKSFTRRAAVYVALGEHELAMSDYQTAAKLDPSNAQVQSKMAQVRALLAQAKMREKETWGGKFR